MKKSLFVMLFVSLFFLNSCGINTLWKNIRDISSHSDELIDISNGIEYNGSMYFYKFRLPTDHYGFYDCDPNSHQYGRVGYFVDMYGALGDINLTCEEDFENNILKVSSSGMVYLYLKEDFNLPDYKEIKIEEIFVTKEDNTYDDIQSETDIYDSGEKVFSADSKENICITDLIDFEKTVRYNDATDTTFNLVCTLADYENIYLGLYDIFEKEESLFVLIDSIDSLYKVRDEYQELIKSKLIT